MRIGYLVTPETLGFVSGGYSWQRNEIAAAPFELQWDSDGYFVGAGLETVLSGNWTLKSEYRFSDHGAAQPFGDVFAPVDLSLSSHSFAVGVNYRLGGKDGGGATFVVPEYKWTGFHIGGAVGAGALVSPQPSAVLFALSGDGVLGELSVGYDREIGENWVVGLSASARASSLSSRTFFGDEIELKADYGFDVLARAGAKLNNSTLAYALGGYSWQHFEIGADGVKTDAGSSGYTVGAGLETAVTENVAVNLEYRYSKFGNEDFGVGVDFGFEPVFHTVRVGTKYKFN